MAKQRESVKEKNGIIQEKMKIKLEGIHQRIDIAESIMWEIKENMNIWYIMGNMKNL